MIIMIIIMLSIPHDPRIWVLFVLVVCLYLSPDRLSCTYLDFGWAPAAALFSLSPLISWTRRSGRGSQGSPVWIDALDQGETEREGWGLLFISNLLCYIFLSQLSSVKSCVPLAARRPYIRFESTRTLGHITNKLYSLFVQFL